MTYDEAKQLSDEIHASKKWFTWALNTSRGVIQTETRGIWAVVALSTESGKPTRFDCPEDFRAVNGVEVITPSRIEAVKREYDRMTMPLATARESARRSTEGAKVAA